MKCLIADLLSAEAMNSITALGIEISYNDKLKDQALLDALVEFTPEILIVRSTKVTREMFEACEPLSLVIRAGAGTNTIDKAAATEHGVAVCNCPGCNSVAVAELTFGLALCQDRRIPDCVADLRNGQWRKGHYSTGIGMKGRTFGIVGFGAIGKEVAQRALAFDMNVLFYDPFVTAEAGAELGCTKHEVLLDLVRESDFISVHVPPIEGVTVGMINLEFIQAMRPHATVLNMSRGAIFDDEGTLAGLAEREDVWICADVFNSEPSAKTADFVHPIAQHPRCYGSHHIGASTEQAVAAVGARVVEIVTQFHADGSFLFQVNK